MILIGHRGCSYPGYNQNTIRAFKKVTEEGVPAIEFDVQLCRDGQLVVVHNLNLEEVSNGEGEVISTDSTVLKALYAGDPARGKDRIPFLAEVFDFFTSLQPKTRPLIHLELKGDNTGKPVGEMIKKYLAEEKLRLSDFLVSSFNWHELERIRKICPALKIALLDGAIRRTELLIKTGMSAESCFDGVFAYGSEQYMLPRFETLEENLELLKQKCTDPHLIKLLAAEIETCLDGGYYNEDLLDAACRMNAESVNLWCRTVSQEFVDKAHKRSLAVLAYTANDPDEIVSLARMGVDGIFTDYYSESAALLAELSNSIS